MNLPPRILQTALQRKPDLRDEAGMALIVAICLLAVMSLFGAMLLNNSTSEIQLSGNYQTHQNAFYVADGAINYATGHPATVNDVDLYNDTNPATGNSYLSEITLVANATLEPSAETIDDGDASTPDDDRNSMIFLWEGAAPAGSGTEVNANSSTTGNYYTIRAVGLAPFDAGRPLAEQTPSRADIRAMVWKGK